MGKNKKNRRKGPGRCNYYNQRKDRKGMQELTETANDGSLKVYTNPKRRILSDEPRVSVEGRVADKNTPSNHKSSESAKNEKKSTVSCVGEKRTLEQLERDLALKNSRSLPPSVGKSNFRRQRSQEPVTRKRPLISSFFKNSIHDFLLPDQKLKRRRIDVQSRKINDRELDNSTKELDIEKKPAVAKISNNSNKANSENTEKQRKQPNTNQKPGNSAKLSNTKEMQSLTHLNSSNSSYAKKSSSQHSNRSAPLTNSLLSLNEHLRSDPKTSLYDHQNSRKTTKERDQKCDALEEKNAVKIPDILLPKCPEPITSKLNDNNSEQTNAGCGSEILATGIEIHRLPTQNVKPQQPNESTKCKVVADSDHSKTESAHRDNLSIDSKNRSSLTKEKKSGQHEMINRKILPNTNEESTAHREKLAKAKSTLDEEIKVEVECRNIGKSKGVPKTRMASCNDTVQTSIYESIKINQGRNESGETENLEEKGEPRESFEALTKAASNSQSNKVCVTKLAKSIKRNHQATIDENDTIDMVTPSVCGQNTSMPSSILVCNSTERADSSASELINLKKTTSFKRDGLEADFHTPSTMCLEGVSQLKDKSHNQNVGGDETSSLDPSYVPSNEIHDSQDTDPTNEKINIENTKTKSQKHLIAEKDTLRDLYDDLDEIDEQSQIDKGKSLQNSNGNGTEITVQNDISSSGVTATITPSKGMISDHDGACRSQKPQQSTSHPGIKDLDRVEEPVELEKSQTNMFTQTSARESRFVKTKHSVSPQLQELIIPPDVSTTKLMYNYHYAICIKELFQKKQASSLLDSSCDDETLKGHDGPFEPSKFSSTVFHMLLDSIGYEIRKTSDSKKSNLIRQISKEKKPTQTPDSVRDFIIDVIKQTNGTDVTLKFLRLTAQSFRLVCHSLLSAYKPCTDDIDTKSKKLKSKQEKKSEIMKRSLLTLIICLRTLLARLMEKIYTPEEENKICGLRRFFVVNGSLSEAELLLLDIVPLLTNMDREHGTLGSKRSIALLKHLVKLEKSFAVLETNDHCESIKTDSINGVMELFMRQLLHQEEKNSGLIKELKHCQSKLSLKGILSCTLPSMTDSCKMVVDRIVSHRKSFLKEFVKSSSPKPQDHKKFVKVTPGTTSSTSESYPLEDSIWYDQKSEIEKLKYNELRVDGCIYISTILDVLRSMPGSRVITEEEKLKEAKRNKLSRTVFFLFHILWENDPFPGDSFHAKSLHRRENLKSAALACFILAGKILDQPVSMKRLLALANKAAFPSHSFLSTSMSGVVETSELNFGEPSKNLIKEYESHLFSCGFGFIAPIYDEINAPEKLLSAIEIDNFSYEGFQRAFDHPGYTHSQISLIDNHKLVASAVYLFSCKVEGTTPLKQVQNIHPEEQPDAECLSAYMSDVVSYVRWRKNQILNNNATSPMLLPTTPKAPDFESLFNEFII